jgi:hypothetical protein
LAALLLIISNLGIALGADDPECTKYVPQVGKTVRVPCEDASSPPPSSAPAAAPSAPAAAAPPAPRGRELAGADRLKNNLVEMTQAINSASGDASFRDSFCTMVAAAKFMHEEKDKKVVGRLQADHSALEQQLGERGRLLYSATLTEPLNTILGTPVDDALPATRLEETPEGQTFLNARDAFVRKMNCSCAREGTTKRLYCCDSCDNETLRRRAEEALREPNP